MHAITSIELTPLAAARILDRGSTLVNPVPVYYRAVAAAMVRFALAQGA